MMLLREPVSIDMRAERWNTIDELFGEASGLAGPEREAFLRTRCGEDADLLREVRSLLDADASQPSFLEWSVPQETAVAADARVRKREGDLIGREVGNYRVTRFIAAGGMGAVYEARQRQPNRAVAMKFLRAAWVTHAARQRFDMETEALARMRHPGVAQIFDAGTIDDAMGPLLYFAMEFVADAQNLIAFVAQRNLSLAQRLELFAQVCDAVHHGHQRGIIHRDLKPANILVDGNGQPKVIDFGVARLADSDIQLTRSETPVVGTLAYMSPEQLDAAGDAKDVDTRSDVYALGVVLFELLCDQLPFDMNNRGLSDAMRLIRDTQPQRPSSVNHSIGVELDAVTLKALEKEPARRYQSAAELAEDVRRFLRHEPVNARPATGAYHLRKWARRNQSLVIISFAALTIAVAGLVIGMVVASNKAAQAKAAEDNAQQQARRAESEAEAALQVSKSLVKLLRVTDPTESDKHFEQQMMLSQTPQALLDLSVDIINQQLAQYPAARASLLEQMAEVYANMGRFDESRMVGEQALELRRTHQGEKHIDVAGSLAALAWLAFRQNDYPRSEELARQAYDIALAAGGPDDLKTLNILHKARSIHIAAGRYEMAETDSRMLLEAVERDVRVSTMDDALLDLAEVLRLRGRLDESAAMYQRGYDLRRGRLGDAHPDTGAALYCLAHVQCQRGDVPAIDKLLVIAQEQSALAQQLAENHPHRSGALLLLGELRMARGELDSAENLLRECLARRQTNLPAGNRLIAYAQGLLGECLMRRGELDEAGELLHASYDILRRDYGEHAAWTVDARSRLAQLEANSR